MFQSSLILDTDDAVSSLEWSLLFYGKYRLFMPVIHILSMLQLTLSIPEESKSKSKAKSNADVDGGNFSRYWKSREFINTFKSFMPHVLHYSKMKDSPEMFGLLDIAFDSMQVSSL